MVTHTIEISSTGARVPVVSVKGEQEEQHAENILALCYPGHRFDIDRMQCEQRAHNQTGPGQPGRPPQQKKQQHCIGGVQQEIDVVVADRIELKDLAIQGMRQPSQRMPVSVAKSRERPFHRVPSQAALNLGIFQNIGRVIEIDELVMNDGIVKSERGRHQQETEDDDALFARTRT